MLKKTIKSSKIYVKPPGDKSWILLNLESTRRRLIQFGSIIKVSDDCESPFKSLYIVSYLKLDLFVILVAFSSGSNWKESYF